MRNILLSVVVVATLVAAGVGGTLADFSDIEISEGNSFSTGALDLVVSDYAGNEYQGDTVPAFVALSNAWPCCTKDYYIDIHNYGQGDQFIPWLYLHFKNFGCTFVEPKLIYEWIRCEDTDNDGDLDCVICTQAEIDAGLCKPVNEPEFVAECGGVVGEDENGDPIVVPGVGCCYGENCQLDEHVDLVIFMAGPYDHGDVPTSDDVPDLDWAPVDLSAYDDNDDDVIKLSEIVCEELELGQLENCQMLWLDLRIHLQDVPEAYFGMDYCDDDGKWDHWPTNALQKDALEFDMAFELLQNRWVP